MLFFVNSIFRFRCLVILKQELRPPHQLSERQWLTASLDLTKSGKICKIEILEEILSDRISLKPTKNYMKMLPTKCNFIDDYDQSLILNKAMREYS